MDLPTERKKFLNDLYKKQVNESLKDEGDYTEWLEKNLFSFIGTECNLNFLNRLIKEVELMEESAKEYEFTFNKQKMDSSSACSGAMAVAYRLVINKLKENIR